MPKWTAAGATGPATTRTGSPRPGCGGLQKPLASNTTCKPAPCLGNAHGRLPRKPQRNGTPAETAFSPNGRRLCRPRTPGTFHTVWWRGGRAKGGGFRLPWHCCGADAGHDGAALAHGGGEQKESGPGVAPRGGKSRSWGFATSDGAGTLPRHQGKSWQGMSRVGTLGPGLGSP